MIQIFKRIPALRAFVIGLLHLLTATALQSAIINVKIVSPASTYTSHDAVAIAAELNNMLAVAPGYAGSSASSFVDAGRGLVESYYHPSYRAATRSVLDTKYSYLVIVPEAYFLSDYPEATFEGVLQMSNRALKAGSTPLLLIPRGTSSYNNLNNLGPNAYRIAHGCGIAAVPGGYAVNSANLSFATSSLDLQRQSYLIAASLFTKITGLTAASTSYAPSNAGTPIDVANLSGIAASTLTTHQNTIHYSTSRENSGNIRFRPFTPANNTVRFAWTGSSTETGINGKLIEILQATGYTVASYKVSSTQGWSSDTLTTATPAFNLYPNQYLFAYNRNSYITGQSLINTNQANLMPLFFDRHYDGMGSGSTSINNVLDDVYNRTDDSEWENRVFGWGGVPVHLGAARLNDVSPTMIFSTDGIHVTAPLYTMISSMMITSALGRAPLPSAAISADPQSLNGLNVGKQIIKQLAFLSETEAFAPESNLAVTTPGTLEKPRWESFAHTFTAIGGTPPYTWSETSEAGLPPGLSLSAGGVLSGSITNTPQTWQMVIKVTDSVGCIRKMPFALTMTAGAGSLVIAQSTGLSFVGNVGGSFLPEMQSYTLTNPGLTSIQWSTANTLPWLTLSLTGGILAAGESTIITVSINPGANALAGGNYNDTVIFTNTSNGYGNTSRSISLRVNIPPVSDAGSNQTVAFNEISFWKPSDIPLLAWYDATDSATITQVGGVVSQWASKVGVSHMVQATSTRRPLSGSYQINGLNSISFDGTDDALKTTTNPFGASISNAMIMGVFNVGTITTNSTLFSLTGSNTAANRWQGYAPWSDGVLYFDCGGGAPPNRISVASGWSANQNKLLGYYASTTDNVQQLWVDGTSRVSDVSGHAVNTSSGMSLGHDGTTGYDNCRMGEVLIINGTVNATNRQKLESYLAYKWGMASNLPVNHLYKAAPAHEGGTMVYLDGSASDAEGDPLTTIWSLVSGPATVFFSNANAIDTTALFTTAGTYTLRLTVNDGVGQGAQDMVITIAPSESYNVAYVGNGNTAGSAPSSQTKTHDVALLLSGAGTLVRTGYTFAGWNTAADGSGTSYAADAVYNLNSLAVMYANWTANPYAVTLDNQGGTGGSSSVTVTYNSPMPTAIVPARTGYTFGGYYTQVSGGGTQYYTAAMTSGISWNITAATTLYAKWTPIAYVVTFDQQSGTGGSVSATATYGATMPAATAPTRVGYTFGGYYTLADGAGVSYYSAAMESIGSWDIATARTLYAKWTINTYTVTYDGNVNTTGSSPDSQTKTHDIDLTISGSGTLARTRCTFVGWNTAADGSGTNFLIDATYSTNAPVTLYAKWAGDAYVITFDQQSGVGGSGSITATDGSPMPPAIAPTRAGYTFGGYFTEAFGAGTQYYTSAMASVRNWDIASASTLYAKWNLPPEVHAGLDQTVSIDTSSIWTPGITYYPITNDGNSGLSSSKSYTHAVDFGSDAVRALINGVQFQAGGATFGGISGTSATIGTGSTTIATAHAGNLSADPYLNGSSACAMETLVKSMNFNAANGVITLTGLTPGQHYQFRLYNRAYGTTAATRNQTIGFDTNGVSSNIAGSEYTATFNADDAQLAGPGFATFSQVYALTLDYVLAPGVTSLKVYVNAAVAASTYHLYGLTNEKMSNLVATANLAGTVSAPDAQLVNTMWSVVSTPVGGTATFTNATALNTAITFDTLGAYVIRLTASDGTATDFDDVVVTVAGPVDHFMISSIASPQAVGSPINGITITARDSANATATSFSGTVTFGGTAGVTGTSASFLNGVLSRLSITPSILGNNHTFTVNDGKGHTGSMSFNVQSAYAGWSSGPFTNTFSDTSLSNNPDGDSLNNLQEFAFGTDPTSSSIASLAYVLGGNMTRPGVPVLENAGTIQAPIYRAVFARRKDHQLAGLTYTVQFSADLRAWTASAVGLQVQTAVGSAGNIEAVSVPFPASVPLQTLGTAVPKFFRVEVTGN